MCREQGIPGPGKVWQDVAIGSFAASGPGEEPDIAAPHLQAPGNEDRKHSIEMESNHISSECRSGVFWTAKILKNF